MRPLFGWLPKWCKIVKPVCVTGVFAGEESVLAGVIVAKAIEVDVGAVVDEGCGAGVFKGLTGKGELAGRGDGCVGGWDDVGGNAAAGLERFKS